MGNSLRTSLAIATVVVTGSALAAPPTLPKIVGPAHRSWNGPRKPSLPQPPIELVKCKEEYTQVDVQTKDLFIVRSSDGCHLVIRSEKPYFGRIPIPPGSKTPLNIPDREVELRLDHGAIARVDFCGESLEIHAVHDWQKQSMYLVTSKGYVEMNVGYGLTYGEPLAYGRERACWAQVPDQKTLKTSWKTGAALYVMNWGEESRVDDE